jgi:hypothetical protein
VGGKQALPIICLDTNIPAKAVVPNISFADTLNWPPTGLPDIQAPVTLFSIKKHKIKTTASRIKIPTFLSVFKIIQKYAQITN